MIEHRDLKLLQTLVQCFVNATTLTHSDPFSGPRKYRSWELGRKLVVFTFSNTSATTDSSAWARHTHTLVLNMTRHHSAVLSNTAWRPSPHLTSHTHHSPWKAGLISSIKYSKSSVLYKPAFFLIQLFHSYMFHYLYKEKYSNLLQKKIPTSFIFPHVSI